MHCIESRIRAGFAPFLALHPGASLRVCVRRSGPGRWRVRVRFAGPAEACAALAAAWQQQQQQGGGVTPAQATS